MTNDPSAASQIDWPAVLLFLFDLTLRVSLSVRVIMRRRPVGVSLAWLAIILIFPWVGAPIYLTFGELRLGRRRAQRALAIHGPYQQWLNRLRDRNEVDWSHAGLDHEPMARMIEATVGIPAQAGNDLKLIAGADPTFDALIADIDAAKRTCHLEFYIWNDGGRADEVAEALIRAVDRGVECRVLVDDVGSREFLGGEMADRMRHHGVAVRAALPVGILGVALVRFDLRLHRKIVVIDGEVGYTGSLNLVDPRFFKKDADVGEWVDAMVRVRGPVVEAMAATFIEDWELDTGEGLDALTATGDPAPQPEHGCAAVQAVPSGPHLTREGAVQSILLLAIYRARRELILTTPYFIPDESLSTALRSAAERGVDVTLIVPAKVDSKLVKRASRSSDGELLEAGVKVMRFTDGLLHTKSVTVDGELSLFGTMNLDPRSFSLNFEFTLAVYDPEFTDQLRALQQSYLKRSRPGTLATWESRSLFDRLLDNAVRLLSPLL